MIICIYYITIFCAIYKNMQNTLFYSYFLGLLTHAAYELAFIIVIGLMRKIAIKYEKKTMFLISKYALDQI